MTGACARCGVAYMVSPFNKGRQRYCSARCRNAALDTAVAEWRLCSGCARLYPVSRQAVRKGSYQRLHACAIPALEPREAICLTCLTVKAAGHMASAAHKRAAYRARFVPVEPHPTTCSQCGVTFVGKWQTQCPACSSEVHRRSRRRRRARIAAVPSKTYRAVDVYERDGWRCHLCGESTRRDGRWPHPKAPTIDHLVPISAGGGDTLANVATAHSICNTRRGASGPAQLRLIA